MNNLRSQMKNVENHLNKLKLIGDCKPRIRKIIIENADKGLILVINECVKNFLMGNVKLNDELMTKIKKYKKIIRNFSNQDCQKRKKEILVQKGGFLPLLIPTIISVISSLIK